MSQNIRSWIDKHSFTLTLQAIWLAYGIYSWTTFPFFLWAWVASWIALVIFLAGRHLISKA
ncbi:hypothetical protein [Sphingopyxis sp. GW247-27LB]|uniref:hypothetical protein n=1 Tax=Sphingopyxis sp. GW247-27LB TaxID=2012632 RepID=UPI000BA79EF2|nr:hypothetical protein [Sphingopyxis sp. GW247-27LB]PAL23693.1 hypothetical protein CD928_06450 [Sphingopyxis sp. GW247-27LB]